MLARLLLLSFLPFLLLATTDRALQRMKIEQRVALVIGNNNYDSKKLPKLKNPINDAKAMSIKLRELGFKVYYGENLTVRQMDKKLDKFSQKLRDGGVGLFFFAGHGIEYKRENYLMAKNSKVDDKNDVKYESLPLNKILETMEDAGNRLNIVLLDACRNDPFSRGGGGGLAKSTARGTYIVYATSPGDVASDGSGKHGAFTSQILKHIDAPGVPIELMFKKVKTGVINSTNQNQRPWVSNDITGDFYFKLPSKTFSASTKLKLTSTKVEIPKKVKTYPLTITTEPINAKVSITNIKPRYKDAILLKSGNYKVKVSKKGYKTKYLTATLHNQPLEIKVLLEIQVSIEDETKSKHKKLKNGEQKFWDMVTQANTLEYYEFYLEDYPNGYYSKEAKRIISPLKIKFLKEKKQAKANKLALKKSREKDAWQGIENSTFGSDFDEFLQDYPFGKYTEQAKLKAKRYQNNSRFIVILDGLIWQDNEKVKQIKKSWRDSVNYCKNLHLAGYDDWRLPNINELESIIDRNNLHEIKGEFKFAVSSFYWSSSPYNSDSSKAWGVGFFEGNSNIYIENKRVHCNIRCVRTGQ